MLCYGSIIAENRSTDTSLALSLLIFCLVRVGVAIVTSGGDEYSSGAGLECGKLLKSGGKVATAAGLSPKLSATLTTTAAAATAAKLRLSGVLFT